MLGVRPTPCTSAASTSEAMTVLSDRPRCVRAYQWRCQGWPRYSPYIKTEGLQTLTSHFVTRPNDFPEERRRAKRGARRGSTRDLSLDDPQKANSMLSQLLCMHAMVSYKNSRQPNRVSPQQGQVEHRLGTAKEVSLQEDLERVSPSLPRVFHHDPHLGA